VRFEKDELDHRVPKIKGKIPTTDKRPCWYSLFPMEVHFTFMSNLVKLSERCVY
jgi:hypothetical protein